MKHYTIEKLDALHMTKGEIFAELLGDDVEKVDFALPQEWLERVSAKAESLLPYAILEPADSDGSWRNLIAGTTVWSYIGDEPTWGKPLTCCQETWIALKAVDPPRS